MSLARQKQTNLNQLRIKLEEKRVEVAGFEKNGKEIPEELDEVQLQLEDDIALVEAQLVAMRWCMGLNPDKDVHLDEALRLANLGPWMENPEPRVIPAGA